MEKSYRLTSDKYVDLSKDWYYVHGMSNITHKWVEVVVFAKTKNEALGKIDKWLFEHDAYDNYHLYRNNYKPDARRLIREGKVIK